MNYFEPSVERARQLRQAMDTALWACARDVLEESGASPADLDAQDAGPPTDFLDYAAFFDLDVGRRNPDRIDLGVIEDAATHLRVRLAQAIPLEPVTAPPRITNYALATYSSDQLDRMSRWWDDEPANRIALTAAGDAEFDRCLEATAEAMDYLARAAPELHGEIEIIVRDVVLAKPDGTQRLDYSGASSVGLWGAVTLNVEAASDWIYCFHQIVHETAHNLLNAIARDTPLVKADPSVRRRSPIRADARPLSGIFHTAYVSAREALALETLLQWHENGGPMLDAEADAVTDALEKSVLAFRDCVETLSDNEEGATEFGKAVLADCEAVMSENFSLLPI